MHPPYLRRPARPGRRSCRPSLYDVLDACPTITTFKTRDRTDEADLVGARDRTLLLVGFTADLCRAVLAVGAIAEHPYDLVIPIPRSKTNQTGDRTDLSSCPAPHGPPAAPSPPLGQ